MGGFSSSSSLGTPTIQDLTNLYKLYKLAMNILPLILLMTLAASLFFLVEAEGGWKELPRLLERAGMSWEEIRNNENTTGENLSDEFSSGNSRFSQGGCKKDGDCMVTGCSEEVCSGKGEVITTCEIGENFPNPRKFKCSCVEGVCGWQD